MSKGTNNVISVSRKSLTFCGPGIGGLLEMEFAPDSIKDLDVINLQTLSDQVKSFVSTNKIIPCELIIVFDSETYFEKKLEKGSDHQLSQSVQDYVDSVPLIHPSSRLFKINDIYSVVVINRRLYESLKTVFETLDFRVKAVIPELVLSGVGVSNTDFDLKACRLILKSADFIMANSFVNPTISNESDNWINNNKRIALIISFIGILIGISGVGLIVRHTIVTRNATISRIKARPAKSIAAIPTPTPLSVIATPSGSIGELTVNVLNGSGVAGEAGRVREQLEKNGFSNITTGNTIRSPKTIAIVSPRVDQNIRTKILQVLGLISIIENSQTQFDVQITLGNIAP